MATTQMLLTPYDVWLFRDSRPFTAGDDHTASGAFPPMPTVLQGALRTAWLTGNALGVTLQSYLTQAESPARAILGAPGDEALPDASWMKGPFLAETRPTGARLWFPAPANLDCVGGTLLPQPKAELAASSMADGLLPIGAQNGADRCWAPRYLAEEGMAAYLAGHPVPADTVKAEADLLHRETRTGIALQEARAGVVNKVVQEGRLWSVEFIRLQPGYGLALETNLPGLATAPRRLAKLGGEGKAAQVAVTTFTVPPAPALTNPKCLLLYLATPALFCSGTHTGWRPEDWTAVGMPPGAQLVGYLPAPGTVTFGGWDLARRAPRPNRRGVPAGTVYFFECQEPLTPTAYQTLVDTRHNKPLPGPLATVGAGITLLGGWSHV